MESHTSNPPRNPEAESPIEASANIPFSWLEWMDWEG